FPAAVVPCQVLLGIHSAGWAFAWNVGSRSTATPTAAVASPCVRKAWRCKLMAEHVLEFEIVVVGAGPAGLAAACAAAETGGRVALLDETPWLGGQIWRGQQALLSSPAAKSWFEKFQHSGATLLSGASVIGFPQEGVLLAERNTFPVQVIWQQLIIATGARELFLPFPGWTLPGVFGPGGLQALIKNGWPITSERAVVAGSGPLLLVVVDTLRKQGAQVICVAEQAPFKRVFHFAFGLCAHPA